MYKKLIIFLFFLYLMVLGYILLFPLPNGEFVNKNFQAPIQLYFSDELYRGFLNNEYSHEKTQIVWNIALTIPLGFFLYYFYKKYNITLLFIISVFISILPEFIQYLSGLFIGYNYRTIDLNDVLLNYIGILLGIFFTFLIMKVFHYNTIKNLSK